MASYFFSLHTLPQTLCGLARDFTGFKVNESYGIEKRVQILRAVECSFIIQQYKSATQEAML